MGVQTNDIRDIYTILKDNSKVLQKAAETDYIEKYFAVKNCKGYEDREVKHSYLINKYFSDTSVTIVDYINKKLSGELEYEYTKRKKLQKLDTIEFQWECNDLYNDRDASCCNWKAIEW